MDCYPISDASRCPARFPGSKLGEWSGDAERATWIEIFAPRRACVQTEIVGKLG